MVNQVLVIYEEYPARLGTGWNGLMTFCCLRIMTNSLCWLESRQLQMSGHLFWRRFVLFLKHDVAGAFCDQPHTPNSTIKQFIIHIIIFFCPLILIYNIAFVAKFCIIKLFIILSNARRVQLIFCRCFAGWFFFLSFSVVAQMAVIISIARWRYAFDAINCAVRWAPFCYDLLWYGQMVLIGWDGIDSPWHTDAGHYHFGWIYI